MARVAFAISYIIFLNSFKLEDNLQGSKRQFGSVAEGMPFLVGVQR